MITPTKRAQCQSSHIAVFSLFDGDGGTEHSMTELIRNLAERGYTVDLLLIRYRGHVLDALPPGVQVHDWGLRHTWFSLPLLALYLIRHRPRVLLTAKNSANKVAVWARRLARSKVRIVFTARTLLSQRLSSDRIKRWRKLNALRIAYQSADAVVAVSQAVARDAIDLLKLDPERVSVIYNPVVSVALFDKANAPAEHRWLVANNGESLILSVARLNKNKDISTLLRAIALLRRERAIRLLILGDGPEREQLGCLCKELSLDDMVEFAGWVSNPYPYIKAANLVALSSRSEGFGRILAESLALGTAVVSTDCPGGPREILDDGRFGPLVPVGDAGAFAAAIRQVLDHPPDRKQLSRRGMDFSVDNSIHEYLRVLQLSDRSQDLLGIGHP